MVHSLYNCHVVITDISQLPHAIARLQGKSKIEVHSCIEEASRRAIDRNGYACIRRLSVILCSTYTQSYLAIQGRRLELNSYNYSNGVFTI